ncbi:MAG TPA: type II toxin-antitoxin system HigB family toxin [Pyrinomonadaceae bacterium]|nr:type II toxin-antitoxin system HigB family toxin [Pyrinomonadaceae bacterium]
MIILTEDLLIEYTREHPEAKGSVFRWAGIARAAVWENLVQVRRVFPHADRIGHCVVFNIMGNNYRLGYED